jgi:hypothetical protein
LGGLLISILSLIELNFLWVILPLITLVPISLMGRLTPAPTSKGRRPSSGGL